MYAAAVPRVSTLQSSTIASVLKRKASDRGTMLETVKESSFLEASFHSEHSETDVIRSVVSDGEKYRVNGVELTPVKRKTSDMTDRNDKSVSVIVPIAEEADMYKGGVTAAEAKLQFVRSLRSPEAPAKSSRPLSKTRKASHFMESPGGGGGNGGTGDRGHGGQGDRPRSGKKEKGGVRRGGDFPDGGGRPSMGTITSQVPTAIPPPRLSAFFLFLSSDCLPSTVTITSTP